MSQGQVHDPNRFGGPLNESEHHQKKYTLLELNERFLMVHNVSNKHRASMLQQIKGKLEKGAAACMSAEHGRWTSATVDYSTQLTVPLYDVYGCTISEEVYTVWPFNFSAELRKLEGLALILWLLKFLISNLFLCFTPKKGARPIRLIFFSMIFVLAALIMVYAEIDNSGMLIVAGALAILAFLCGVLGLIPLYYEHRQTRNCFVGSLFLLLLGIICLFNGIQGLSAPRPAPPKSSQANTTTSAPAPSPASNSTTLLTASTGSGFQFAGQAPFPDDTIVDSIDSPVHGLCKDVGTEKYFVTLQKYEIDSVEEIAAFTVADFSSIGVPLGPAKKLISEASKRSASGPSRPTESNESNEHPRQASLLDAFTGSWFTPETTHPATLLATEAAQCPNHMKKFQCSAPFTHDCPSQSTTTPESEVAPAAPSEACQKSSHCCPQAHTPLMFAFVFFLLASILVIIVVCCRGDRRFCKRCKACKGPDRDPAHESHCVPCMNTLNETDSIVTEGDACVTIYGMKSQGQSKCCQSSSSVFPIKVIIPYREARRFHAKLCEALPAFQAAQQGSSRY